MDYKKKYKDLLERARKLRDKNCDGCKMCMESLFDELAESEDERIRKAIINTIEDCSPILSPEVQKRMIAWIEKQVPKQKWSENDEENLKHCCYLNKDEILSWLQSLKQRMIE